MYVRECVEKSPIREVRAALINADAFFLVLITRVSLSHVQPRVSTHALKSSGIYRDSLRRVGGAGSFPLQFAATRPRTLRARGKGETGVYRVSRANVEFVNPYSYSVPVRSIHREFFSFLF